MDRADVNRVAQLISIALLMTGAVMTGLAQVQPSIPWQVSEAREAILGFEYAAQSKYSNYSPQNAVTVQTDWRRLGDLLGDRQRSEWAGDYAEATGIVNYRLVRLVPGAGFIALDVYTCSSTVRRMDFGGVSEAPSAFQVSPRIGGGPLAASQRLLKVRWGGCHFLIEEDRIERFCDYAAGLGAFNRRYDPDIGWGEDFLSREEGPASPAGMPEVPDEFRQYVKVPIEADVTSISVSRPKRDEDEMGTLATAIRLAAGSADGLRRGMYLNIPGSTGRLQAKIISVQRRSSSAIVYHYGSSDGGDRVVTKGMRLSTSPYF